jgi:hypothetical protein
LYGTAKGFKLRTEYRYYKALERNIDMYMGVEYFITKYNTPTSARDSMRREYRYVLDKDMWGAAFKSGLVMGGEHFFVEAHFGLGFKHKYVTQRGFREGTNLYLSSRFKATGDYYVPVLPCNLLIGYRF